MGFSIGIALKEYHGKFVVMAACWFTGTPVFNTRGMTLPYMQDKLLSIVVTKAPDEVTAINAAAQRTLEKLYIKRVIKIPPAPGTEITLLVPPYLKKNTFIVPHKPDAKHWLVRGAKRALAEWIGAENVRKQRRRKRTSRRTR